MKRRVLSALLASVMAVSALCMTGCGGKKSGSADNEFSWWIVKTDGEGTYYDKYEENPGIQWLNQQYWDTEGKTLGDKDNGTSLKFSFLTPVAGSEQDNFNTMISTGEYTDIIDMSYASANGLTPEAMYKDGILMDITEYVEKYLPNYVDFLEEHPDVKSKVVSKDEDGDIHYYHLAGLSDGPADPWCGYSYRRDWVVAYAEPTEYVWDWDSAIVQEKGHPAVTPLKDAVAAGNMDGWKKNDLYGKKFTATPGDDPVNTYTDNVIFPSGKEAPYTISDWEWMMEAFQKAIAEREFSGDANAYCISIPYGGMANTGELVSSFGGTGGYYIDPEGKVSHSGTSDEFKLYLQAMNNWYNKGWLDKNFETRASDMFFFINESGVTQGMVGLWLGYTSVLGDVIRATARDSRDAENAFVMGCPLPINDTYGTDAQKYREPDALFQSASVGAGIGITNKAEKKDLAALFSMFNWLYSEEGGKLVSLGLDKEQYESTKFEKDVYKENDISYGYDTIENEDGSVTYRTTYNSTTGITNALRPIRLTAGLSLTGHPQDEHYSIDRQANNKNQDKAIAQYVKYLNTGNILEYMGRLSEEESAVYNKVSTTLTDYCNQIIPKMIKDGLKDWDGYVKTINESGVDEVATYYQKYVDEVKNY